MKLRIFGLLINCLFFSASIVAQSNLEKANKQFELGSYNNAIKSYQKILEKDPINQTAIIRLADCYRMTNKMYDAENWYRKAAQSSKIEPSLYLNYGKVLMANSEYEKAKTWFAKYDTTDRIIAQHYIKHCDFALANKALEPYFEVSNESFNSAAIEFGPVFYKDLLVFSSSRSDIKRAKKLNLDDFQGKFPNQYFKVSVKNSNRIPEFFRSDLTNVYNEGNLSIAPTTSKIAFTRNSFVDGIRIPYQLENNSIFLGEIDPLGTIKNIEPFPFNGTSYSCVFPCLNEDGSELYFASNRPDGFGGYDIYVSKKSGRNWSAPQNLGSKVNTAGNEISPFILGQKLYFSSDFHLGFGGQDIFFTEKTVDGYKNITHLGTGVNSPYDDFNYCYNANLDFGYFVSNRNFKNGEDIYSVKSQTKELKIIVLETESRKPIDEVELEFISPKLTKAKSDNFGQYTIQVPNNTIVQLKANKNGYQSSTKNISLENITNGILEIELKKNSTFNYGLVVNASKSPIPGVIVTAIGEKNGEKFQTETDNEGMYSFTLKEDEVYKIKFSKSGFVEFVKTVKNIKPSDLLGTDQLIAVNNQAENKNSQSTISKNDAVEIGNWAIQLKSVPQMPNLASFDKLKTFGNVYTIQDQKVVKVRVGDYQDKTIAEKVLSKVKGLGYPTAFIVEGQSKSKSKVNKVDQVKTEPNNKSEKENSVVSTEDKPKNDIFIRLVAVKDLKNIDESKLSKIGKVIKEFNGKVYAVYVGSFENSKVAIQMLPECKKLGFKDAYIVKKVNGKYEKI